MNLERKALFRIVTSLECSIHTTERHWEFICFKHPELLGHMDEVVSVLQDPDLVRISKVDSRVYLFYKKQEKYFLCVVCKKLNGHGFVITAYFTDRIKEGELVWQKSN